MQGREGRRRRALGGLLGLALVACSGDEATREDGSSTPPAPEGPFHGEAAPTVVLVSLDTTRADHIGCYGAAHGATPFIDSLAERGILCERAWASNPITLPSHTTMLTGVWPTEHGIEDNGVFTVSPEAETLTEELAARHFRTGAFVGSFILAARRGLDQGFEVYDQPRPWASGSVDQSHRPAEEVTDAALAWLEGIEAREPVFLWLHFYDPHRPWAPPADLRERFGDPYVAEIARCDRQLRRLEEALDARGRGRRLWLLTADHGESMGEHGETTHGAFVYEGAMRIPLIVMADGVAGGQRRTRAAALPDLAPTVLDFLQLPEALPRRRGHSLLAEPAADEPPVYLETFLGFHSHRWHWEQALVQDGYKLIVGKRTFLHSLVDDPAEEVDLSQQEPERLARMRQAFDDFLEAHPPLDWAETSVATDQELLQTLGYAVGGAGDRDEAEALPDPRDRIGDLRLHDEIRGHVQAGSILLGMNAVAVDQTTLGEGLGLDERRREGRRRLGQARARLSELHENNPGDPLFHSMMGQVEVMLGRYQAAVEHLEEALVGNPGDSMSRYYLATAYGRTGHPDWSVIEMHKALSLQPRFVLGYRWIIAHHLDAEEYGLAVWWVRRLGEAVGDLQTVRNLSPMVEAAEQGLARSGAEVEEPELFPLEEPLPEGRREG